MIKSAIQARREQDELTIQRLNGLSADYYAISKDWLERWRGFIRGGFKPPRISHDGLVDGDGRPRPNLLLNVHYEFLNKPQWEYLLSQYGGDPPLICKAKNIYSLLAPVKSMSLYNPLCTAAPDSRIAKSRSYLPAKHRSTTPEPKGMRNPLFYCFINSVIQALMSIGEFCEFFKRPGRKGKVCELVKEIIDYPGQNIDGSRLFRHFHRYFPASDQHDAAEFLRTLLEELDKETNTSKRTRLKDFWEIYNNSHSELVHIFSGVLRSSIKCHRCSKTQYTFEPFTIQSVQFSCSLQESLDRFKEKETIRNQYKCPNCKKFTDISKQYTYEKYPKVLIIHIKRFIQTPRPQKISESIHVPSALNLERTNYALVSAILHSGSLNSGHYVTVAKRENSFYTFDDLTVRRSSSSLSSAYILLYELV